MVAARQAKRVAAKRDVKRAASKAPAKKVAAKKAVRRAASKAPAKKVAAKKAVRRAASRAPAERVAASFDDGAETDASTMTPDTSDCTISVIDCSV